MFLNQRLKAGGPVFFTWSMAPGAVMAEALARAPFEACLVDLQHGMIGFADFLPMLSAMHKAGKPVLARPPLGEHGTAAKLLDAGAAGVIVPMVNTAADARAVVRALKYPPLGERSWGAYPAIAAAGMSSAHYLATANDLTLTLVMIETGEAIHNLETICAVDGVDGVFVGPHDLSISLTGGTVVDAGGAQVADALPKVVAAAGQAGKIAGIYAPTPGHARTFAKLGFGLIALGSDVGFLRAGAQGGHEALGIG